PVSVFLPFSACGGVGIQPASDRELATVGEDARQRWQVANAVARNVDAELTADRVDVFRHRVRIARARKLRPTRRAIASDRGCDRNRHLTTRELSKRRFRRLRDADIALSRTLASE